MVKLSECSKNRGFQHFTMLFSLGVPQGFGLYLKIQERSLIEVFIFVAHSA